MLMLMLLFCMWIHSDDSDSFKTTKQIFDELEIENVTEQDCRLVRHVCSLVSRRAAFLASAGALKIVEDAAGLGSWLPQFLVRNTDFVVVTALKNGSSQMVSFVCCCCLFVCFRTKCRRQKNKQVINCGGVIFGSGRL